jgi:hypothetical protein
MTKPSKPPITIKLERIAMTREEFDDIIQHYRNGFDDGFRRMGQTKDGSVAPVTSTNLYHRLAYLQGCGHGLNVHAETHFGGAKQ